MNNVNKIDLIWPSKQHGWKRKSVTLNSKLIKLADSLLYFCMFCVSLVFLWRILVFPVLSFGNVQATLGRIEHKIEHVETMTGRIERQIPMQFDPSTAEIISQALDEVSRGKSI